MFTSDMAMRGKKSNFGIAAIRLELLRRATTSAEKERRALSCGGATASAQLASLGAAGLK